MRQKVPMIREGAPKCRWERMPASARLFAILAAVLLGSPAAVAVAGKSSGAAGPTKTSTATPTPTPAPAHFGFNDSSSVAGTLSYDDAAAVQARVGATSTRLLIHWSWVENKPDVHSWGIFDGVYWASIKAGIKPLIVFTGAPQWAQRVDTTCVQCDLPPSRSHDADWQDVLRQLVTRYPDAAGIEIWNEPNLGWAWRSGPDPVRYTELLKLAHSAIKSVRPSMPVIGASLAPVLVDATSGDHYGVRPFLKSMYANGARGHMDGIALHPYPYGVNFGTSFKAVGLAREVRAMHGDDATPLWLSELGLTTSGGAFSEHDQAIAVPKLYTTMRQDPEIRGIYVHTVLENDNPTVSERGYGVMRADLTPKPAYCALAMANASTWRCPDTISPAAPSATQNHHWDAQILLQAAADAARRVHLARGSYRNVTAADLSARDSRLRSTSPSGDVTPGPDADPTHVGVWPVTDGRDGLLLCNASRGDRSYCIYTFWDGDRNYGSIAGTVYGAAGATTGYAVTDW